MIRMMRGIENVLSFHNIYFVGFDALLCTNEFYGDIVAPLFA